MALAQANATLSGHVYARDGLPAQGVVLMVDLRSRGFDLVATATTDAQGAYSLTGLPGAPAGLSVGVVAQPWDADADGFADYDALSRSAATYPAATSLLDPRYAAADLLLLTSNVESGTIAPTDPIHLAFNRELDTSLTSVSLYDSSAAKTVAVTTSVDSTSGTLTIVPAGGATLAAYHSYTLVVDGVATNGATLTASRAGGGGSSAAPEPRGDAAPQRRREPDRARAVAAAVRLDGPEPVGRQDGRRRRRAARRRRRDRWPRLVAGARFALAF